MNPLAVEWVEKAEGDDPEFQVRRRADGSPDFRGPFAQGRPADRFFYLSWGVRKPSGDFEMFRRLKIRLGHLTWKDIDAASRKHVPVTVRRRLTDERGGPLCATPSAKHIAWEAP